MPKYLKYQMLETHTVRYCTFYTLTIYAKNEEPLEAHIKNVVNCNLVRAAPNTVF